MIILRLSKIVEENPSLNFHQLLNNSGCSPIEFLKDIGTSILGRYGVIDRRNEISGDTLSRINKKIKIKS